MTTVLTVAAELAGSNVLAVGGGGDGHANAAGQVEPSSHASGLGGFLSEIISLHIRVTVAMVIALASLAL